MQKADRTEQGNARSRRQWFGGLGVLLAAVASGIWWATGPDRPTPPEGVLQGWGRFHAVAHSAEGVAAVYDIRGRHQLHLLGFRTAYRPDLQVLLISAPDAFDNERVKASEILVLGALSPIPDQTFDLPGGVSPAQFRAVTIWLPQHQVNFTTAPLRPPELPPIWQQGKPMLPNNSGGNR